MSGGRAPRTGSGQLHYYQSGGRIYIEVDTYAKTAGPELVVVLDDAIALKGGDFLP